MDFVDKIGNSLYMGGMIFVGRESPLIVMRPGVELNPGDPEDPRSRRHVTTDAFFPDADQFRAIIRQMDLVETEITDEWGAKVIVRKNQRSGDKRVTWEVFRRDGYQCRYCGVYGGERGAILTYDHIKLWEDGGEWSLENGVCACAKCNRQRGNTDYAEWIRGPIYTRKSENLSLDVIEANLALINEYGGFPRRTSSRRR